MTEHICMRFTIRVKYNPAGLTFDRASQIQEAIARLGSSIEFDEGFGGEATVYTHDPLHYEAVKTLEDSGANFIDMCADGTVRFSEYFGLPVRLDAGKALVYCDMCKEGRI